MKKNHQNLEKDLRKLSTMLKKKGNKSFQNNLRQQLLAEAETMNAKEETAAVITETLETGKSPAKWFDYSALTRLFKNGFVPALALAVIILFSLNIFGPTLQIEPVQFVNVAEAKDYYTLTPSQEDPSGIATDTTFTLESKGKITVADVEQNLEISPETGIEVSQKGSNKVIIKPNTKLEEGEVYSFELNAQNIESSPYKKEYSWAYQVSDELAVTGTIPANETTDISVKTGIEVHFNNYGITPEAFENGFTIEPHVPGTFSVNGKTTIFAPSNLETETIYTVTLSENLSIPNSDKSLAEDHTFQFQTSHFDAKTPSIGFRREVYEFANNKQPAIQVNHRSRELYKEITGTLYRFNSADEIQKAFEEKFVDSPSWIGTEKWDVDVSKLQTVGEFEKLPIFESNNNDFFELPINLDQGHYIFELENANGKKQIMLQISDAATLLNVNATKSFLWMHDITTKRPVKNAKVERIGAEGSSTTTEHGFADLSNLNIELSEGRSANNLFKVTHPDGVITYYVGSFWGIGRSKDYWEYTETDRATYHPTDTVYYWSFIQGNDEPASGKAKVQLIPTSWTYGQHSSPEEIYFEKEIELIDGEIIDGSIEIDRLPTDYYYIRIIQGEETLSSTIFNVEHFTKPEYEITITPDQTTLFSGESTTMNINTAFFEGTPVPNLALRYADNYNTESSTITTNELGEATQEFSQTPGACDKEERWCPLFTNFRPTVSPVREELAEIGGSTRITVARSNVGASKTNLKRNEITLQLNKVDLDKASELSYPSENQDVWGNIATNEKVDILIEEIEQVRERTGEYYNALMKTVQPTYRYQTLYHEVRNETLVSSKLGQISYKPNLDEDKNYRVSMWIFGDNGQSYKIIRNLGADYSYANDFLTLDGLNVEDTYEIGEKIEFTVADPDGNQLPDNGTASYIYSYGQENVMANIQSDSPHFSAEFTEEFVPNIQMKAYAYDGERYRSSMPNGISFNKSSRRLDIEASTDLPKYEPGENVELSVTVKDKNGAPVANAFTNIYLVDEAYYALFSENFNDPLTYMYREAWTNFGSLYESHREALLFDGGKGGCFIAGTKILMADGSTKNIEDIKTNDQILTRANEINGQMVAGKVLKTYEHTVAKYLLINNNLGVTGEHIIFLNGQWQLAENAKPGDTLLSDDGNLITINSIDKIQKPIKVYNFEVEKYHTYFANGHYVHNQKGGTRDVFKDTAIFKVVRTDKNGNARVNFELPDNITSWRASIASIKSGKIHAGHTSINIPVTKPAFAVPVINPNYLLDDKPSLPLRAYGDALDSESDINFTLNVPNLNFKESVMGKAFIPAYINMPPLELGEHRVEVTMEHGEFTDTIALNTKVSKSHLKANKKWEAPLTENIQIPGSEDDRTTVILTNAETGPIYSTLLQGTYSYIKRADIAASKQMAKNLLNQYFDEDNKIKTFDYSNYQKEGISVVPYGDSDLTLTAKLLSLDENIWDKNSARRYFLKIFNSKEETLTRKIKALYGLGTVGNPMMTELNYFTANHDLTQEDHLFAALAYLEFGADDKASEHFIELMEFAVGHKDGAYIQSETRDNELSFTALAAYMASELRDNRHEDLWSYVIAHKYDHTETVLLEKMLYANSRLKAGMQGTVTATINGEKISIEGYNSHKIALLPEERKNLSIENITGNIHVISLYEAPLNAATTETSDEISIVRTYKVNGQETKTFSPGDLVEIHFDIQVPRGFEGSYDVRDYLPSGFQPTTGRRQIEEDGRNSQFHYPYNIEGQEVHLYEYCSKQFTCAQGRHLYYLARVINKGTFVEEPAVLQSFEDPSLMNVSAQEKSSILIE